MNLRAKAYEEGIRFLWRMLRGPVRSGRLLGVVLGESRTSLLLQMDSLPSLQLKLFQNEKFLFAFLSIWKHVYGVSKKKT